VSETEAFMASGLEHKTLGILPRMLHAIVHIVVCNTDHVGLVGCLGSTLMIDTVVQFFLFRLHFILDMAFSRTRRHNMKYYNR